MTGHASLALAGDSFARTVDTGPLVLAILVAVIAGLVSFLSPCVLPLVPGYLSYVTGLTGADMQDGRKARLRVLLGSAGFVAGFTAVFVAYGALFGGLGRQLALHQRLMEELLGGLIVVLGLAFLGVVPGMDRQVRMRWLPASGVAGAPLLGIVFGIGWTPCVGPTLGAVQGLAYESASAGRGAVLSAAYCVGLGIPFLLFGQGFRWVLGTVGVVRRHAQWVTRVGGVMLVVVGVLLLTGWWDDLTRDLRTWVGSFTTVV